jgi:dTDP-L-rhamnose 4-epimerase
LPGKVSQCPLILQWRQGWLWGNLPSQTGNRVMHVLITGGAGFIGSHIADALVARGDQVTLLDSLDPQVHPQPPTYVNPSARLVTGDVRNAEVVRSVLQGIDAVIHNAAAVGVGQSMYKIEHYVDVNCRGSAVLWEAILQTKSIKKIIVASSMSVYGEGAYTDSKGRRLTESFSRGAGSFEIHSRDGEALTPIPTDELKRLEPSSVYAITKRDQEEIFLSLGEAYGIPVTAFRYFNVIGSRQALSNPYTGVAAIFCSRLINGKAPLVFEDGNQLRDFVHVGDIVQANLLALDSSCVGVFNIGSGAPISIADLAREIAKAINLSIEPEISGKIRVGDIRHCYADISKAAQHLGYKPRYSIKDSVKELVSWLRTQSAEEDRVEISMRELGEAELLK